MLNSSTLLQGNVAVFFCGIGHSFGGQLLEGTDDAEAGVAWFDYVVDVAEFSRVVGVAEEFVVFRFLLGEHLFGIFRCFRFFGI